MRAAPPIEAPRIEPVPPHLDAEAWVAALPIDGTRKTASLRIPDGEEPIVEQVGEDCYVESWSGERLEASSEPTDFGAYMVHDRVVSIVVTARRASGFDAVRSALVARLGKPKVESARDTGVVLRWRRPVPITAQHLGDDIYVMIGTYSGRCR